MSIRHRIFIGLFTIGIMFVLTALFTLVASKKAVRNYEMLTAQTIPVIESVEKIMFTGLRIVSSTSEYALVYNHLDESVEEIKEIEQAIELFDKNISEYEGIIKEHFPDEITHFEDIRNAGYVLMEKAESVILLSKTEHNYDEVMSLKNEMEVAEGLFLNSINSALEHEEVEIATRKDITQASMQMTENVIIISTIFASLLIIVFGTLTVRAIIIPVGNLIKITREIGRGNLDVSIEHKNNDEIKELGESITRMASDLSSILVSRQEIEESERQLHALSQRVITMQEEERARISRELHDELGQRLSILNVEVELLRKQPQPTATSVERLSAMLNELSHELVRIYRGMSPRVVERFGLVYAIEYLVDEYRESNKFNIEFTHDVPDEFSPGEGTILHVYRLVQEALTNVSKHSGANNVLIDLKHKYNDIILEISDDGKGISHDKAMTSSGIGIIGMKERALICGGKLMIDTSPGEGVTIKLIVPNVVMEESKQNDKNINS